MWRTISIWRLLKKLQEICNETEAKHPNHSTEEGHSFRAATSEVGFLKKVANGDAIRQAQYADLLVLAEKMNFLDVKIVKEKCKDCKKDLNVKFIRLNSSGLEFLSLLDLIEYLIKKYKLTWTLMVGPIVGVILGAYIKDLLG